MSFGIGGTESVVWREAILMDMRSEFEVEFAMFARVEAQQMTLMRSMVGLA